MAVKPHFAPNHEVDVPRKAKLSQAIAHGGQRCHWCGEDPLYVAYHDLTWGRPVQRPRELFMKLCLDGQQAGLSWITILKKEQNAAGETVNRITDEMVRLSSFRGQKAVVLFLSSYT